MTEDNIPVQIEKTVIIVFIAKELKKRKSDVTQWLHFVHNVFNLQGHGIELK